MAFNIFLFFGISVIFCIPFSNPPVANALVGLEVAPVNRGEYSYVVSIMHYLPTQPRPTQQHICTGALITRSHVLTAQQCTEDRSYDETIVVAGSNSLQGGRGFRIQWWISYCEWMQHRRRRWPRTHNDLSVIFLATDVDNDIPHGSLSEHRTDDYYGANAVLAGWGLTNENVLANFMLKGAVTILSNNECSERVSRIQRQRMSVHVKNFCSVAHPLVLLQEGDFGGPIIYDNRIIGISQDAIPFPDTPVHEGKVNLHTSIDFYRDFIGDVTRNNFRWQ